MRNMSFSATTQQIIDRKKTVTRRLGWAFLKPGDLVQAVEKGQGLKKGEKVKPLAVLRIVSNRPEPLNMISDADVRREGFPRMGAIAFIVMFIHLNRCDTDKVVNRIEFEYVD